MTVIATYQRGDELPGVDLPWEDATGTPLNLSSGYTFTLQLVSRSGGSTVTPTVTVVGYNGGARWTSWNQNDLDIAVGTYAIHLTATETATGKQRTYSPHSRPLIGIR